MRALVRSALVAVALGALGVAGVTAASARSAVPHTVTTTADIVCTGPIDPGPARAPVTTEATGSGYPANTPIVVQEIVSLNGTVWQGSKTGYTTSATGDWKTPATPYAATESGLYEYTVTVTDPDGKVTYGTAYDACKL
jgi:hypothetical protein